jgi:hypothetical protein
MLHGTSHASGYYVHVWAPFLLQLFDPSMCEVKYGHMLGLRVLHLDFILLTQYYVVLTLVEYRISMLFKKNQ